MSSRSVVLAAPQQCVVIAALPVAKAVDRQLRAAGARFRCRCRPCGLAWLVRESGAQILGGAALFHQMPIRRIGSAAGPCESHVVVGSQKVEAGVQKLTAVGLHEAVDRVLRRRARLSARNRLAGVVVVSTPSWYCFMLPTQFGCALRVGPEQPEVDLVEVGAAHADRHRQRSRGEHRVDGLHPVQDVLQCRSSAASLPAW